MEIELVGVAAGAATTIAGVWMTWWHEARRRRAEALLKVSRLFLSLELACRRADEAKSYDIAAEHAVAQSLHEIELLVPALPLRLRTFIQSCVEVLSERQFIDVHPHRAVSLVSHAARRAIKQAQRTPVDRWRRVEVPDRLREYIEYLPVLEEEREENYRAQQGWEAEQRCAPRGDATTEE